MYISKVPSHNLIYFHLKAVICHISLGFLWGFSEYYYHYYYYRQPNHRQMDHFPRLFVIVTIP